MSFGFGFALPAYPLRGGGGNNPFNQLGPTLDLSFIGTAGDLSGTDTYTLNTDFITPEYQVAAQYAVWVDGSGMVARNFADIVTFTRASTATYFNSAGTLTSAAINEARFDYNPSTLAAQGFLIEEARTNLLTWSEDFSNVAWTKINSSITANATTSPSGTVTADKLVEGTQTGVHSANQSATVSAGSVVTASIFFKPAERNECLLILDDGTGVNFAQVGIVSGVGTVASGGSATNVSGSAISVGNGWLRIVVTCAPTISYTTARARVMPMNGGTAAYTGDGTSGLFIWGAQLEAGAFPTSYIPTTTTALTRSADVASVNTLSPWWNSAGGTLYAESFRTTIAAVSTFPSYAEFDNGTLNRYGVYNALTAGANEYRSFVQDAGVSQADIGGAASRVAAGTVVKQAAAFAANDFALSVNGSSVFTDTAGTLPSSVNRLSIGSSYISANFANAWIRRITYYPRRLSNADLQTITT